MNKWHFQTLCTSYCLKQAEKTLHILLAEVHNIEESLGQSQGLNLMQQNRLIIIKKYYYYFCYDVILHLAHAKLDFSPSPIGGCLVNKHQ